MFNNDVIFNNDISGNIAITGDASFNDIVTVKNKLDIVPMTGNTSSTYALRMLITTINGGAGGWESSDHYAWDLAPGYVGWHLHFLFRAETRGYIHANGTVEQIDFTGQHRSIIKNVHVNDVPNYISLRESRLGSLGLKF